MKAIQLKSKPFASDNRTLNFWTILRQRTSRFIQRNGTIFEGLSRQSQPFGGNVVTRR